MRFIAFSAAAACLSATAFAEPPIRQAAETCRPSYSLAEADGDARGAILLVAGGRDAPRAQPRPERPRPTRPCLRLASVSGE